MVLQQPAVLVPAEGTSHRATASFCASWAAILAVVVACLMGWFLMLLGSASATVALPFLHSSPGAMKEAHDTRCGLVGLLQDTKEKSKCQSRWSTTQKNKSNQTDDATHGSKNDAKQLTGTSGKTQRGVRGSSVSR